MSDSVGARFTGNGDVLAFAYNNDVPVNGIGFGRAAGGETGPVGPTIAGLIDSGHTPKLEDGMVIEEGAIPSALRADPAGAAGDGRRQVRRGHR